METPYINEKKERRDRKKGRMFQEKEKELKGSQSRPRGVM